jgi:hypothetical protein
VPRAYEPFKAYNSSLEEKNPKLEKTANFNLKYLFRYMNDKNNKLSRFSTASLIQSQTQ